MSTKNHPTVPARKKPAGLKTKQSRTPSPVAAPVPRPEATGPAGFTFLVNPTLTLVALPVDAPVWFSLESAARLTGVHPEMLRYYCRAGLVDSLHGFADGEPGFEEAALQEVRRIEHYRRHLAVSRRALPLVCELRRNAERQHIEIQFLRYP